MECTQGVRTLRGVVMSVTIRSSQKVFTEDEGSRTDGICLDHLRQFWLARKHLGFLGKLLPRANRPGSGSLPVPT